jgi:hypothetical protein
VGHNRRLHLTELDTATPDLNLVVGSAQVLEHSVSPISRLVAGTVKASTQAERIVDEAISGQLWPIEVTSRHPHASDAQLGWDARWNQA